MESSQAPKSHKELERELGECMLSNWKLCAAGIALGMPLSIHRIRTAGSGLAAYAPFLMGGILGTAADYYQAYTSDCAELRRRVQELVAEGKT